jgi:hypothetical protein
MRDMSKDITPFSELDELEDGAIIYGGGESVTGIPCIIIALVLMATAPTR